MKLIWRASSPVLLSFNNRHKVLNRTRRSNWTFYILCWKWFVWLLYCTLTLNKCSLVNNYAIKGWSEMLVCARRFTEQSRLELALFDKCPQRKATVCHVIGYQPPTFLSVSAVAAISWIKLVLSFCVCIVIYLGVRYRIRCPDFWDWWSRRILVDGWNCLFVLGIMLYERPCFLLESMILIRIYIFILTCILMWIWLSL